MLNSKFLSLLGMARKANRVELGYDKSLEAIHKLKAKAVFVADDISEKTKKGLIFAAEDKNIPVISVDYSIFDITNAVGTKTGIVAVTDSGFAKSFLKLVE
ncbi:MAG: L7Ae/L30e/S12e/Gadd45 family ribosomal protein [Acutalibacteraceae bacterium]